LERWGACNTLFNGIEGWRKMLSLLESGLSVRKHEGGVVI